MIEGYFDPAGRPYVRAYVVVPGLQSAPEATALLLDTGADNTFIQPAGARILGIRTQNLSPTGTSRGIGGTTSYATVPAFIAFQERPWPWRKTRACGHSDIRRQRKWLQRYETIVKAPVPKAGCLLAQRLHFV